MTGPLPTKDFGGWKSFYGSEVMAVPYEVKPGEGETYDVVNKDTGEVKATHTPPDAKEKAEKQVKLLHAVENDPEWSASHE